MKWTSIGTTAGSLSTCRDRREACAGFTLIEALVAMTLLLAFVSVLGPHLFHARRIADGVDGRIAAQALLRTLVDAPLNRSLLAQGGCSGETAGLRWSMIAEPMFVDAMMPAAADLIPAVASKPSEPVQKRIAWAAFHLTVTVSWAPGRSLAADTIRLGSEGDE
jgi:hypothetical protein